MLRALPALSLVAVLVLPVPSDASGQTPTGVTIQISAGGVTFPPDGQLAASGGGFAIATDGRRHITELTMAGPATTGRRWLYQWLDALVKGDEQFRLATLTMGEYLSSRAWRGWTFSTVFPVRYVFPELNVYDQGAAREELVVQANYPVEEGVGGSSSPPMTEELMAGRFSVAIDGQPLARGVVAVSIDDLVIPTLPVAPMPGEPQSFSPGQPQWGNVTLTVRPGVGEFAEWWRSVEEGAVDRRGIDIELLDGGGGAVRGIGLGDAMPVSYDPFELVSWGTRMVAVEKITLSIGRLYLEVY